MFTLEDLFFVTDKDIAGIEKSDTTTLNIFVSLLIQRNRIHLRMNLDSIGDFYELNGRLLTALSGFGIDYLQSTQNLSRSKLLILLREHSFFVPSVNGDFKAKTDLGILDRDIPLLFPLLTELSETLDTQQSLLGRLRQGGHSSLTAPEQALFLRCEEKVKLFFQKLIDLLSRIIAEIHLLEVDVVELAHQVDLFSQEYGIVKDSDYLFDALVIVHPTGGEPINIHYKDNLLVLIHGYSSRKKPVFFFDDIPVHDPEIQGALQKVGAYSFMQFVQKQVEKEQGSIDLIHSAPFQEYCLEAFADEIVLKVNKERANIRLAFGGLFGHACVYAYAIILCEKVVTDFPGKMHKPILHPIGFGSILDTII